MKSLYGRLITGYAILHLLLLTGLGIVLGQFFPLFYKGMNLEIQRFYLLYLIIVLLIAFMISLFITGRMMLNYAKPVDEVTKIATRLAQGDLFARTPTMGQGYDNQLSMAVNSISRTMQEMSMLQAMEKERLNTLVESMGSGLLMFGREGTVNLANGVFKEIFGFSDTNIIGETISSINLPVEIKALIEDVHMTEQAKEKQVHLNEEPVQSSVSVYGAPVINNHGNWLGIVVVIHDITELIRLEEVRKDFVANVSHELRTPVTSIKGFTETLLDGAMDNRDIMIEFLGIIQKESDRLQLLIEDLLELSGIETNGFSLEIMPVNLKDVVNEALQIVSTNVERKKMKVIFDLPTDIIIEGDKGRLIQVMVNLLSNAIAYSKIEKTVKVNIEVVEEDVLIVVEDEGIGIEALELTRLFERFYRVDRARSRDSGGTGLGLAIVKHLVEAHGGFVDVESAPGVGTSIKVQLPLKANVRDSETIH